MMKSVSVMVTALMLSACATVPDAALSAVSQPAAPCAPGATHAQQSIQTTSGPLHYDVCAGTITIQAQDGTPSADLFYTAYIVQDNGADRPLSFVWNGGPGADSRLLHFSGLGPRIIEDGALRDNATTPLIASDLVFLDPAGTGFSRPRSERAATALYGTVGDIDATKRFIMQFQDLYAREGSPLFLIGESFGTWRAAGTAEALADAGVEVAGIGLVSGGIPLGEDRDRALVRSLSLPNRTVTALALGRLQPDLQAMEMGAVDQATEWARSVWYPALSDPSAPSDAERAEIVAGLARYHGMDAGQIDQETLWVSPRDFRTGLLDGQMLDVFDMRQIQNDAEGEDDGNAAAVVSYYRDALGYAEGRYAGIEVEADPVGSKWQYDQAPITEESLARAMAGEGPPSPSQPWTLRAMQKLPGMRTFVAAGLYDSLNSCAANEAIVTALPPEVGSRIMLHCYAGGHMMYDTAPVRRQFNSDVTAFLKNAE